jgi:hypothetical protein
MVKAFGCTKISNMHLTPYIFTKKIRSQTMLEHWIRFLLSALLILLGLFALAFILTAVAAFLLPAVGLIIAPAGVAYLGALYWLWTETVPSNDELIGFENAKVLDAYRQRLTALDQLVAGGDAKAAESLGDMYLRGLDDSYKRKQFLVVPNKELALRFYDISANTRESARKKAAALRSEQQQLKADLERKLSEERQPQTLDAMCPNCRSPLAKQSLKCHACGALFGVNGSDWSPVPLDKKISQTTDTLIPMQASAESIPFMARIAPVLLWVAHLCSAISALLLLVRTASSDAFDFIGFAIIFYIAWYVVKKQNSAKK